MVDPNLQACLKSEFASLQNILLAELKSCVAGALAEHRGASAFSLQSVRPPDGDRAVGVGSAINGDNSVNVDELDSESEAGEHATIRQRTLNHSGTVDTQGTEVSMKSDASKASTAFSRLFGFGTQNTMKHSLQTKREISFQREGGFQRLGSGLADNEYDDLDKDVYDVSMFYKKAGIWQAVARTHSFQGCSLFVIALNAAYMGIEAEYNSETALWSSQWPFVLAENAFCTFFTCELTIRFCAFAFKWDCLKDGWFKFDALLTLLTVVETWFSGLVFVIWGAERMVPDVGPLRVLRLLRLARLARLVRLARKIPELVTLVKGLRNACRGVLSTLFLIAIVNYIFALFLHNMIGSKEGEVKEYFETFSKCMWTLLVQGTLMDNSNLVLTRLRDLNSANGAIALCLFLAYIALTGFALLNLLIGVMCEVVTKVSSEERSDAALKMMKQTILKELKAHDPEGRGYIGSDVLTSVLESEESRETLQRLQIDMTYVQDFRSLMASAHGGDTVIPVKQAMEMLLLCRGDQPASVRSISVAARLTHAIIEQAFQRHKKVLNRVLTRKVP